MVMTLTAVKTEVDGYASRVQGTLIDHDGAYGAQCVDLILHYIDTVHGEPHLRGNGDTLTRNLIVTRGWGDISTSSKLQSGDVVSKYTGYYGGHIYVVLEDLGSSIRYLDQNGEGSADYPKGEITIRTAPKANLIAVARPPRYMGATGSITPPAPPSALQVLTSGTRKADGSVDLPGLANAQAIIDAAKTTGVRLHVAAAMILQESGGKNVWGHDYNGIYSTNPGPATVGGVTYPAGATITVTRADYLTFLDLLLNPDGTRTGRVSNGVGPAQLTWWEIFRDARAAGVDLSDPAQNITWGLRKLGGHLAGDYGKTSVQEAGTLYNKGDLSSGINTYGASLWTNSEKWRLALAGATVTTGPTAPSTPAPPDPTDPTGGALTPVETGVDPGPHADLTPTGADAPVALPDPTPGPVRPDREHISTPSVWVLYRGQRWSPRASDGGMNIDWDLGIPGPDQSPLGSGMIAASGHVTLSRPRTVTKRGWAAWRDDPPTPGEDIVIIATTDQQTLEPIFTGEVDGTDFTLDDDGITLRVIEKTGDFAGKHSMSARNFRMPAAQDGASYQRIGLHSVYYSNLAARAAGYYCTPPMDRATTMVSVPMVGSMYPERGVLLGCKTMDSKGSTEGVSSDSPDYTKTWWGTTTTNAFARIRPEMPSGVAGRLTRTTGLRMLVGPTTASPAIVELFWADHSIMVQISNGGITVETQDRWIPDGYRNVLFSRNRPLSAEQRGSGFELQIWFAPDGGLTIGVDGSVSTHTPFPWWPSSAVELSLQEVRLTARPYAAPIGGFVLVSSSDRGVFGPWERRFHPDIDPRWMLAGGPALVDKPGLELLREKAEAQAGALYLDERGHLHEVCRLGMDSRPSTRTLTRRDVVTPAGKADRGSLASAVSGKWRAPSLNQRRLSSGFYMQVHELPSDRLEPGQIWEEIVTVPDGEDWIHVDGTFLDISTSTALEANRRVGSAAGGTTILEDAEGKETTGVAARSWFWIEAERITHRTYRVRAQYTPPDGVRADLELSTHEDLKASGLRPSLTGKGPILRARGKQTWEDKAAASRPTGVSPKVAGPHERDGSWWVQSAGEMSRLLDRDRQMLATPIPSWGPVELATPDLSIKRAATVSHTWSGAPKPARVAGMGFTFDAAGLHQTVTLRQLRP